MNKVINNIVIVGGGTSGWLTVAHLRFNLPEQVKITLIESSKIGTIGVGEGTQPFTTAFMMECGLTPDQWMNECDSTYKLGVELNGWVDNPVFVDNDTSDMAVLGNGIMMHEYVLGSKKTKQEFLDWIPSYQLAKNNISPKLNDARLDFTFGLNGQSWDAVHFRADKIVETLKSKFKDRITYYDAIVTDVNVSNNGVESVILDNGEHLTADLFIDCTGFKSLLLEQSLKEPFISFNDTLLCNRAVALPKDYNANRKEAMHPSTKATAMTAGWRWTIPTWSRIGNGYVYCDKFITPEEAEKELRESIGEFDAPANHLTMKIGKHQNIAVKNVYAVGLSAGFVEPLEATGITFTTKAVQNLTKMLLTKNGNYDDESREWLSREFESMIDEIHDFIFLHYYLSKKDDTDFWKAVKEVPVTHRINKLLSVFKPMPPNSLNLPGMFTMFHVGQWFELLFLMGFYDDVEVTTKSPVMKYGDMVWDLYKDKTQKQLEVFPNHALYLKDWYGNVIHD